MCPHWFQSFLFPSRAGPHLRPVGGGKGRLAWRRAPVAKLLGNPPLQLCAAAARRRRPSLFKFSDAIIWETCSPVPARGPRVRDGPLAAAARSPLPLSFSLLSSLPPTLLWDSCKYRACPCEFGGCRSTKPREVFERQSTRPSP